MKVRVKDFAVEMELGAKGITLDVYSPNGDEYLGDIRIGKAKIEWCNGKKRNGVEVSWKELIDWFNSRE